MSGEKNYLINYDPFDYKLIINWIFDEYASETGGDIINIVYKNFNDIIMQDENIIKIFISEIKSVDGHTIIRRIIEMLERVIDVEQNYIKNISTFAQLKKKDIYSVKTSNLLNVVSSYVNSDESIIFDYIHIMENIKLTDYNEFFYSASLISSHSGHAIGTYFKKIKENDFLFYIINTGSGAEYQNINEDLLTNKGILCFNINSDKINFIYGILFATKGYMTVMFFYNVLMRILFKDATQINNMETEKSLTLVQSPFFKKSIDTKLQVMGNCTVVAVVYVIEILLKENNDTDSNISDEFLNLYNKIKIVLLHYTLDFFSKTYDLNSISSYNLFIKLNETYLRLGKNYNYDFFDKKNNLILKNLYNKYVNYIENCTSVEKINEIFIDNCNKIQTVLKKEKNDKFDLSNLKLPNELNKVIVKEINNKLGEILEKYEKSNFEDVGNFEQIENILLDFANYVNLIVYISDNSFDYMINRFWQYKMIFFVNNFYKKFKNLVKADKLNKNYDTKIIIKCVRYICYYCNSLNIDYYTKFYVKNFIKINDLQTDNYSIENPNTDKIFIGADNLDISNIKRNVYTIGNKSVSDYKYTIFDTIIANFIKFCGLLHEYQTEIKIIDNCEKDKEILKKFNACYVITNNEETNLLIEINEETIKESSNFFLVTNKTAIKDNTTIGENYSQQSVNSMYENKTLLQNTLKSDLPPGQKLRRSNHVKSADITSDDLINNSFFKKINVRISHTRDKESISPTSSGDICIKKFLNYFEEEINQQLFTDSKDFFDYFDTNFYKSTDSKWLLLYLNILYYKGNFEEINFLHEEYIKTHLSILTTFDINFKSAVNNIYYVTNTDDIINNIEFYFYGIYSNSFSYSKFANYFLNYGIIDENEKNYIMFNDNNEDKFNHQINRAIYSRDYFSSLLIKISDMMLKNLIKKDCYSDIFNMVITIINLGITLNVQLNKSAELISALNVITNNFNPIIKILLNYWIETDYEINLDEILQLVDKLKKFDKIENNEDDLANRFHWNGNFALLFNIILNYSNNNLELKNKLINNDYYYNIIYDHENDKSHSLIQNKLTNFHQDRINIFDNESYLSTEYNYYNNYKKNNLCKFEYLKKIKKYQLLDSSENHLILIGSHKKKSEKKIVEYKNLKFEFEQHNLLYNYYSLNKFYFGDFVTEETAIHISKINVFNGIDNSYLQLYYLSDYSLINNLQYKFSTDESETHYSTLNENLIEIVLNKEPYITINKNKILSIFELITIKNAFYLYTKILLFCNMNINDRKSKIITSDYDGQTRKYNNNEYYNEIIPVIINNKIYFNCYQLNIFFIYDMDKNKLFYLNEDVEIVTDKNYYYINRFVYNTNCLVAKENEKYSFLVMDKNSKSINFVQYNNNGIFTEKKLDTLIYFIKEQINAYKIHEAHILLINYEQLKDSVLSDSDDKISITLIPFKNNDNIYNNYYYDIMKANVNIFYNCTKTYIHKNDLSIAMLEYYNFFNFNIITTKQVNIDNLSFLSNDPIIYENMDISQTFSLFGALYIYNYFDEHKSTDTIIYPMKKYISSYQHFNFSTPVSKKFEFTIKNHNNTKKAIRKDSWNNGENLLEGIDIYKKMINKYYYKIDKEKLNIQNISNEYICDGNLIIDDYDNFYKNNIDKNTFITKENLIKLKITFASEINKCKNEINSSNISSLVQHFNNMIHLDAIYDFDINYINLVMLLCKYQSIIEEINLYLSTDSEEYIIDKIINIMDLLPIFIDNEINTGIIIFEYIVGYHIRQKQYDFSIKLFNEILLKNINTGPNFHQMLMGEGKSSVIAPVLTLLLIYDGDLLKTQQIYHVMPISLINQSFDIFNKIFYFIKRNSLKLINNYNKMNDYKINVISDYLLKYSKIISNTDDGFDMRTNIFIYDEIDEVSDPLKSQLNIIATKPKTLNNINNMYHFIHNFIHKLYFDPVHEQMRKKLEKYQFGRIPHLINQGSEYDSRAETIIKELYINVIEEIFGINYRKCCEKLLTNTSLELCRQQCINLNYDVVNIIYKFYKLLPSILKMLHRRHFGQKYNDLYNIQTETNNSTPEINIYNNKFVSKKYKDFIAVPYISNETPAKKSEFSNYLMTIALTIITYYENSSRRIRNLDIQVYLNYIKENYYLNSYLKDIDNFWFNMYNDFTRNLPVKNKPTINPKLNVKEFTETDILILVNIFNIKTYLLKILLPKIIKNMEDFHNISFIDIIKSSFSPHRIGFTGTPFIHKPIEYNSIYEIKSIQRQKLGDGAIVASILGFTRKSIFHKNKNTKEEVIKIAVEENYHCIVDVGSYFINEKNSNIAINILLKLKEINSEKICVVFIDENHKKMCVLENETIINYESVSIPLIKRFYYFDQSHITGIDVKIYNYAKGLITISSFNRYRDVAQGIFRMRNINFGQTVDFCFNENYVLNLNKKNIDLITMLIYN